MQCQIDEIPSACFVVLEKLRGNVLGGTDKSLRGLYCFHSQVEL